MNTAQHSGRITQPKTFSERVVELALMIPKGKVSTYGHIARAAGGGGQAARSVNQILAKYENSLPANASAKKHIPFHRIVYAGGKIWSNSEYHMSRMVTYKKEGIDIDKKGNIRDFWEKLYEFR